MKTKIIRVGTSVGMIIPAIIAKDFNFSVGTQIEITESENKIIIQKPKELRKGWAKAFENYAQNEQESLLPDFLGIEAESYL